MRWALLLLLALAPGCTNLHEVRVIYVEDAFAVEAPEGAQFEADMGGHCAAAVVALDPPHVTLRYLGTSERTPRAVVVRVFSPEGPIVTMSADRTETHRLADATGSVTLLAPIAPSHALLNVTIREDDALVDGAIVGAPAVLERSWQAQGANGVVGNVTETIHVRDLGLVPATVDRRAGCD